MPKVSTKSLTYARCQKAAIARDKDGNPKQSYLWDSSVRGFGLRITSNGTKTFCLKYINPDGKQAWALLGEFTDERSLDEAREKAIQARRDVKSGKDPRKTEDEKNPPRVKDLVKRYKKEHLPDLSPSWRKETERLLDKHVLPSIGEVAIRSIGPAEISKLHFDLKTETPIQANRVRAVLRVMFGRAEEWGLRPLGTNPVTVIKQRAKEPKRERRLTDLELKSLGKALKKSDESKHVQAAIKLALLAGMRKGEILTLRWEWVDLDAGEIRIPVKLEDGTAGHKTAKKTGKPRVIHLCNALVQVLKKLPKLIGNPYVIVGREPKTHLINLQSPWERIRQDAGLAEAGEPKEEDPGIHDLRRTFSSVASDIGLKGFASELLGHAEQSVTDIYTRTAAAPLHDAAEKIGARIDGILSGKIDPEKEIKERKSAAKKQRKQA